MALNQLGETLGFGPENWSVALSPTGDAPATHYGTHVWEAPGGAFHQLRTAVEAGLTPPGLEAYAAALASLSVRAQEGSTDASANWTAACAALALSPVAA